MSRLDALKAKNKSIDIESLIDKNHENKAEDFNEITETLPQEIEEIIIPKESSESIIPIEPIVPTQPAMPTETLVAGRTDECVKCSALFTKVNLKKIRIMSSRLGLPMHEYINQCILKEKIYVDSITIDEYCEIIYDLCNEEETKGTEHKTIYLCPQAKDFIDNICKQTGAKITRYENYVINKISL